MFRRLKNRELRSILAQLRFPHDPVAREKFERDSQPLHCSSELWIERHPEANNSARITTAELFVLLREDRRADILHRLEKMEEHYAKVATLDSREVERRLLAASPDDLGVAPYKKALVNGADPRRAIAEAILRQIPIARRHVEQGEEALELVEVERLNARANELLVAPHVRRGIRVLTQENADRADLILWVEGPHDVEVFRKWLLKIPDPKNASVAILPLAGHQAASRHFALEELLKANPKCLVILDSERKEAQGRVEKARRQTAHRLEKANVPFILTERRATENYFSGKALSSVYPNVPNEIDRFRELNRQINGFSKHDNGTIAQAMDWNELAETDIGRALISFVHGFTEASRLGSVAVDVKSKDGKIP